MIPIVPAIIPKSLEDLELSLDKVSFTDEVQIDVVDGVFVPSVSWPYFPQGRPFEIEKKIKEFTVEIDLMVKNPIEEAKEWIEVGVEMLVFHIEELDYKSFKKFIDNTSISVGVSVLNKTSFDNIIPYIEISDYIQLMGIAEIGSQGQPFDSSVLDKIRLIKNKFPDKMISIDGSVNKDTIADLIEAGADRLISGSAILKSDNPLESYKKLLELTNI
ncbi:MAG: hypothetical protein R3B60_03200 [Candidatus Paceibacterota bacterium]